MAQNPGALEEPLRCGCANAAINVSFVAGRLFVRALMLAPASTGDVLTVTLASSRCAVGRAPLLGSGTRGFLHFRYTRNGGGKGYSGHLV